MGKKLILLLLCLALVVQELRADLCVKCKNWTRLQFLGYKFDTEGTWTFYLDTKTYEPNVFDKKIHCGHHQPNR